MTGYVVINAAGRYLERRPYDGAWTWSASGRYATVFSYGEACKLAAQFTDAWAKADYWGRSPEGQKAVAS